MSTYPYVFKFKTGKKIDCYVFNFISEFIGTKTKGQCKNYWHHLSKDYETIDIMINSLKVNQGISANIEEKKLKYFWQCIQKLIIFHLTKNE